MSNKTMSQYLSIFYIYHIATARDLFRTGGCLQYVTDLVKETESQDILQASLYTLGCATENNGD